MDEQNKQTLKALAINDDQWNEAMVNSERTVMLCGENGVNYWLKKIAPARGFWRYRALNFFSRVTGLTLLRAVPQPGGVDALVTERNRIKQLNQAGVLVPQIFAYSDHWLLMSNLGQSVVSQFKDSEVEGGYKKQLLTACLTAIKGVHQLDQCLSQAFVRNMVQVNEDQFNMGFIDFEDDPLMVMSLPEAQARDLLLFINSVARFFLKEQAFFEQQITDFLLNHKPEVIHLLKQTTKKLQWITRVPFQRAFGHDYQKLKLGLVSLRHLSKSS